MILLELDPNIVKPGWTPLLILVGLGVVMFLLFRSMKRHFRAVDRHWAPTETDSTPEEPTVDGPTSGPGPTPTSVPTAGEAPSPRVADGRTAPRS